MVKENLLEVLKTAEKAHIPVTAVIAQASWLIYPVGSSFGVNDISLILIVFFGIFIDIDHIPNLKYAVNAALGRGRPAVLGRVNYLHTWWVAIVVAILSVATRNPLVFVSYASHIIMDAANRANEAQPTNPFPTWIYKHWPKKLMWLTYWLPQGNLDENEWKNEKKKVSHLRPAEK